MNKKIFLIFILTILLSGIIFVYKNLDCIMSIKANYYFKKNNYEQAIKHFEKAFEMGLHNHNDREIYANILINSPINTNIQSKLLNFLNYPIEDSAKNKINHFLYDYRQEIHNKFTDNYISQAPFNQNIVRWNNLPIKYSIENSNEIPNYYKNEIENAFLEWEKATEHKLLFIEDSTEPNIIIKFIKENPADENDKKYVVAYTKIKVIGNTLKKMNIDFYIKNNQNKYFSKNQIYNTALHEIAHALGFMGHSNNPNNVMYLTKDSYKVYYDKRDELTEADINTIKLLYNIKPDITNSEDKKNNGIYLPNIVLGNDEEINIAKKREAKTYIQNAPTLPGGWIDLAESYASQEDYISAIKSLEKAFELSETLDVQKLIYYNLAVCYLQIDDTEMARKYAYKAIEINDDEELHIILADSYAKENNFKKASDEYNYLFKKNPKNINYTIGLTNLYLIQKDFVNARKTLKQYVKSNPNDKKNPRFNSYGILKLFL